MREPNARVRPKEKLELSLDGRQIASVVVVALVLLGVVFVLGLSVGKQIAARQAEAALPGDLDALDRAPAPALPAKAEPLTFHDRLTKETPAPPPPVAAPAAAPVAIPAAAPPPEPAAPAPRAEPAPAPAEERAPLPQPSPASKAWTIQLAAAQDRGEADRLAARFASLNPRVEAADVPGKGRFYRVRVGGFDTKDEAERYLRDVARETRAKGFVTPAR